MSRKDYVAAARIVRAAHYLSSDARARLVADLAAWFKTDNPRFDLHRFARACEPELSERDRLEARGYRDGYAAASWFTPKDERTARWLLDGIDDGDPEVLDYLPAPRLGGEYADEPTWSNILEDEGCDDSDDGRPELLDAYSYAYSCAVDREIVRACRDLLGLVPADLGAR